MNTFILVPRGASGGKGRFLKKLPLDPAKTFVKRYAPAS